MRSIIILRLFHINIYLISINEILKIKNKISQVLPDQKHIISNSIYLTSSYGLMWFYLFS